MNFVMVGQVGGQSPESSKEARSHRSLWMEGAAEVYGSLGK